MRYYVTRYVRGYEHIESEYIYRIRFIIMRPNIKSDKIWKLNYCYAI